MVYTEPPREAEELAMLTLDSKAEPRVKDMEPPIRKACERETSCVTDQ